MRITFGEVLAEERKRVRHQLEAYCKQDTQAMIDILSELERLTHVEAKPQQATR